MACIQEHISFLQEPLRISVLEGAASDSAEPNPFHLAVVDLPPVSVIPPLDNDQEQ